VSCLKLQIAGQPAKDLEADKGQSWTTEELQRNIGFASSFAYVRRKSNGRLGTLEFTHHPASVLRHEHRQVHRRKAIYKDGLALLLAKIGHRPLRELTALEVRDGGHVRRRPRDHRHGGWLRDAGRATPRASSASQKGRKCIGCRLSW